MPNGSDHAGSWPTTHWSLVGDAGTGGTEVRRQALTSLLKIYSPVLKSHLLKRGTPKSNVDDLLQEFLLSRILEKNILQLADQGRGNFRSFLATALDNFLRNTYRDQSAAKRRAIQAGALDDDANLPANGATPADSFDYAWARQVLGQAIRRMRRLCAQGNRADIWGVFKWRILLPSLRNVEPTPYGELVAMLHIDSATQASNLLVTAGRMFTRCLRNVLSVYQVSQEDIENEIRDLWRAVSRPGAGRP